MKTFAERMKIKSPNENELQYEQIIFLRNVENWIIGNYDLNAKAFKNNDNNHRKNCWLIGAPGIGKTKVLIELMKWLTENEYQFSGIDFESSQNDFDNLNDVVLVDGYNELSSITKELVNNEMMRNSRLIILTSWTQYLPSSLTLEFKYEVNDDFLDRFNLGQSEKIFLKKLTYRQVNILLENKEKFKGAIGNWDALQKMYENIVNRATSIKGNEKSPWVFFKKNIIDSKEFPFTKYNFTIEQQEELLRLGILQKFEYGFFVNNMEFLVSVKIRKYIKLIKNDDYTWLKSYLLSIESEALEKNLAVLIWFASALENKLFVEILLKYYQNFDAGLITKFIYKSFAHGDISTIYLKNIRFNSLSSLLWVAKFFDYEEFYKLITTKKTNYVNYQYVDESQIIELLNCSTLTKGHWVLMFVLLHINNGRDDDEVLLTSKLKTTIFKMNGCIEPIKFSYIDDYQLCLTMLFNEGFTLFGWKWITNLEFLINRFSEISPLYAKETFTLYDVEQFELFVENKLDFLKEKKKDFCDLLDGLVYATDKSSILEYASTYLHELNNNLSSDKYKNRFLKSFVAYGYILLNGRIFSEIYVLNENAVNVFKLQYGQLNDDVDRNKVINYRMVNRSLKDLLRLLVKKPIFESLFVSSPIITFQKSYHKFVGDKIEQITNMQLDACNIDNNIIVDSLSKLEFQHDNKTFKPFFFDLSFNTSDSRIEFYSLDNSCAIDHEQVADKPLHWYWDHYCPGFPTNEMHFFKNVSDFIYHHDVANDFKILFTCDNELHKRYYEMTFYKKVNSKSFYFTQDIRLSDYDRKECTQLHRHDEWKKYE